MQIIPNRVHHVTIAVNSLKKEAKDMDYELEYQSGSLLQGAFGQIDVSQLPAEKEIMLGTCSAGGACTYHEDVKGGTLVTRFSGAGDPYALKNDWRYFENNGELTEVSSRDAKFQLNSEDLNQADYVIVANSPGAPEGVDNELISDIYGLSASDELNGEGELSIRVEEEAAAAVIMGYDGSKWTEFETKLDGKQAQAQVELMSVYVVVK
jgi:hypothetical protein